MTCEARMILSDRPDTFIRVSIEVDDRSEILAELKTLASRLSEWVRDVA